MLQKVRLEHGEHEDNKDEETRCRTVVLCPGREMSSSNHVLRQEADDDPGDVVHRARGRNEADAREHDAVPCVSCTFRLRGRVLTGS